MEFINPPPTRWQKKWLRLDVIHPKLAELCDAAEHFCSRWFSNNSEKSLLVIVGNFGSGKSHTAKAIYRFCSCASMPAFETKKWPGTNLPQSMLLSWPELAGEFNEKNFSILQDCFTVSLLVLDDIGAESDPWKVCADRLCQIFSRRERMFTVVTTNIQPTEWADRFDGRIADRLFRNSVIVDLTGVPSYSMKG